MREIASPLDGFASPFGPGRRTLTNLLFGQNEPGFTFEPWDMTTLYQDRAGTTPVTAVGQSVGYRRDKSGRGNHEVAINDAARGVYGREPEGGTRNRLTYTEQFDNAAWGKNLVSITPNYDTAPDESITADRFVSSGGSFPQIAQTLTLTAGQAYTFSAWVKSDGTSQIAQALLLEGGVAAFTPTSTWTRVSVSIASSAGGSRSVVVATNSGVASASSFLIWGAQLELGATATAYQKVVSQYDITEAGVPSCYYVQTDGVDDACVTPTITPGTDKVQVFAGVRKNSDAATGMIAELSAVSSNAGTFALYNNAAASNTWRSRGTVTVDVTGASSASPVSIVFTGLGDISGDRATLRINGVQVAQSTADQGTGNYLAYPAYLYARGGTTLPFNGRDYGHAVRFGPNLDAATIARVEALIARNTPTVTL